MESLLREELREEGRERERERPTCLFITKRREQEEVELVS